MNGKINLYRRNGKKVYIKQPEFNELEFVAKLWGDEETMADIGGAYLFPEERWEMFYKKMVSPTDGKNFYCIIYTVRDKAIGEVSFHGYDSATKVARANIKIHHRYRNKGYAEEAIKLLLEYYFLEFGGETIIDTIKTEPAENLFKKVGFENIGNFRNQVTYKINKDKFFSIKDQKKRKIKVLAYNEMNINDYSIAFEMFERANELLNDDIFEVNGVGYGEEVTLQNGIKVTALKTFEDEADKPDIIIIPGGKGAEMAVKDKFIIRYLLANYNDSDYLLSLSEGMYFLNRCRMLDGILVPIVKNVNEEAYSSTKDINLVEKDFTDNGKLIISANKVGAIKGCLNIIKKIAGEEIASIISSELGVK